MNPYVQYMYSYPHKTAYRPLRDISLREYTPLLSGGGHGLYLHLPFCQAKCGYCNLFSVTGQSKEAVDGYLETVERQAGQYGALLAAYGARFLDLVIGGGTPLFLTEAQLERIFCLLDTHFEFSEGRELVIETAPNQTTKEKLAILKRAGVTRVSMGIQSFDNKELAALRRMHTAERAREALALLKSFDFPTVNVDFIYGIPGQTKESLLASLKEAALFRPDEIFLYPLYVKRGVGLWREGVVPDPESAYGQYLRARDYLLEEGFRQDSMRRFVRRKEGREFSECGLSTSLGLGCGGRSYLGRLHFSTPYAVSGRECLARLKEYEDTVDFTRITHGILLTEEELKRRYVIRHLLIRPGLETGRYEERFGGKVMEDFPILGEWMDQGYVELRESKEPRTAACGEAGGLPKESADGGREAAGTKRRRKQEIYLGLTETGMGLSDYLGPQLISWQIQKAMKEWQERNEI